MKEIDREIQVGENRFYFGKDGIMYVEIVGDLDSTFALAMKNAYLKLLSCVNEKVNILVDNSRTGKPSQESRKIFNELIKHEQIGKIAVFGLNPVARVIASFVLGNARNLNSKIFKMKADALEWLSNKN